jgi:hypothetical protein
MMKALSMLLVCVAATVGCKTHQGWTEATLAEGRYQIDVPNITDIVGTNCNPIVWVHECGRIQIQVPTSFDGSETEVWIDWLDGTVSGYVVSSNGTHAQDFEIMPLATNVTVKTRRIE